VAHLFESTVYLDHMLYPLITEQGFVTEVRYLGRILLSLHR
jgi:Zn-dependent M16 (insulinase) family peptidase